MILVNESPDKRFVIIDGNKMITNYKPKKVKHHKLIKDYYIDEFERYRDEEGKYYWILGKGEYKRHFSVDKTRFESGVSKSCCTAVIEPVGVITFNGYPIYVDMVNGVYMISVKGYDIKHIRDFLEDVQAVPVNTMWDFLQSEMNDKRYL